MAVFISYNHQQGHWVWDQLVPILQASGVKYLIDRERFQAGKGVLGQMDKTQQQADKHILVLSADYYQSDYCQHEMEQAIAQDPDFNEGRVLPIRLDDTALPDSITDKNPLYINLQNDQDAAQWALLLKPCGAALETTAPAWLEARNDIRQYLERKDSVNLLLGSTVGTNTALMLMEHLRQTAFAQFHLIDLQSGSTASRRGLLSSMIEGLGGHTQLSSKPEDLVEFSRFVRLQADALVALTQFDLVGTSERQEEYGVDLFAAWRDLMQHQHLTFLFISRQSFKSLLPAGHPLSDPDVKTVDLNGQP